MAAYAALVSLLNNIHAVTKHPHLSTSLDNKQIQPLLEKSNFLLDFIEGNTYGRGSEEVRDLERKIAAAAHAAEDLIESHIVDQIHFGKSGASLACSLDLQQSIHDMDAVMGMVMQIEDKREVKEEISTHLAVAEPLKQGGESRMVGLDEELNQPLDDLTDDQSRLRVISIVGMGGIGKTTIAKTVYQNRLIREVFHICAWGNISQQINAREILSQLLSCLGESSSGEVDDLGLQLHMILSGAKYLVILDDICSVTAWDEVKHFFPDNNNASRVLLTTRLSNVARDCGSSIFKMNLLDEDSSWKLFCEKVFKDEDCPFELRQVGEQIVKSCNGLPLSIVVIGGLLLKSPKTLTYWTGVKQHLKSISNSEENQECLDVLSLSYNYLPPHLKSCFLYMGAFKKDSEISVSRIISLWVAEGFVKPIESRVLEEIAEGYINDLIDRNLIFVGVHRNNGKVKSFRIHPLLRDLSITLAEQEEFHYWNKGEIQDTGVANWNMGSKEVKLPLARSIITEECTMQPSKHRLLRVLDEGSFGSKRDYFENVNLRYLYIHQWDTFNHLGELPTSISLLWNLQILIIKSSFGPLIAPIEIWKMQQLRQVLCFPIYLPCPPPRNEQVELVILDNLNTLKTTVNLRLSDEVCKIIPNIMKLYLWYDLKLHGYDDSLIGCLGNVNHLRRLESLNIRWPISGGELPTSFPTSLRKLSLSRCELHWDDMLIIGSLPLLEDLKLEDIDALGEGQWSPLEGQFCSLRFLLLKHCRNLVYWDADESHFPRLEKLLLDGLWRLKEIPYSFGEIPTLELIDVDFCSISTAISAVIINVEQLDYGNNELRVEVRVAEWHLDRFNQILEAEGLTIDYIHFKTFHDDDTDDETD